MRVIAGGLIAFVLLGYYVYLVIVGVCVVLHCDGLPTCTAYVSANFTSMMGQLLALLGGLVSATVVAELAVTNKAVSQPGDHLLPADASRKKRNIVRGLTGVYILVWIGTGLGALLVTSRHAETLPSLTNLGLAWIGLAITAAYSYLGIQPAATTPAR